LLTSTWRRTIGPFHVPPAKANRATTSTTHQRISTLISSSPRPGSDGAPDLHASRGTAAGDEREYVGACTAGSITAATRRVRTATFSARRRRRREVVAFACARKASETARASRPPRRRDNPARGEIRCRALDISRDDQEADAPLTAVWALVFGGLGSFRFYTG